MSGDGARVAYPLFQTEDGGANPTSPLQLKIRVIELDTAMRLNKLWHSRLPDFYMGTCRIEWICFGAMYKNKWYASAIWSAPIARALNGKNFLELRRLAIAEDAPKNTATRMISIMTKIIKQKFPHIIKLISYQDTEVHQGTIYKASGWYKGLYSKGADWKSTMPNRSRRHSVTTADKIRWEKDLR
jgi:hypothetical protein